MENLNFVGLSKAVAEQLGLSGEEGRRTVAVVLDEMARALAEGREVRVSNFGTLRKGERHYGPSPVAPVAGTVPYVKFTVTGRLKEALRTGAFTTIRKDPQS